MSMHPFFTEQLVNEHRQALHREADDQRLIERSQTVRRSNSRRDRSGFSALRRTTVFFTKRSARATKGALVLVPARRWARFNPKAPR